MEWLTLGDKGNTNYWYNEELLLFPCLAEGTAK